MHKYIVKQDEKYLKCWKYIIECDYPIMYDMVTFLIDALFELFFFVRTPLLSEG
jgi:hypothetical protein